MRGECQPFPLVVVHEEHVVGQHLAEGQGLVGRLRLRRGGAGGGEIAHRSGPSGWRFMAPVGAGISLPRSGLAFRCPGRGWRFVAPVGAGVSLLRSGLASCCPGQGRYHTVFACHCRRRAAFHYPGWGRHRMAPGMAGISLIPSRLPSRAPVRVGMLPGRARGRRGLQPRPGGCDDRDPALRVAAPAPGTDRTVVRNHRHGLVLRNIVACRRGKLDPIGKMCQRC